MNIIDILTWAVGGFLTWAVFSAVVVARMKFRDEKSWHRWIIVFLGKEWDVYRIDRLDNSCSYWLALVSVPIILLAILVIVIVFGVVFLAIWATIVFGRIVARLFWFSMNGETVYLTKGVKGMLTEGMLTGSPDPLLGTNSFKMARSPIVIAFLGWVVYRLAFVNYSEVINTIQQGNWHGILVSVGVIAGLILAYKGIEVAWPTIRKTLEIIHGKVCYRLPYKEE